MKIIKNSIENHQKKKEQKKLILRKKNFELRERGKDPHKGWHPMVDTGSGGANVHSLKSIEAPSILPETMTKHSTIF